MIFLFLLGFMAGHIPRSFIDDLLARLDIVDIIDARVKLKKKRQKLRRLLPISQRENTVIQREPREAVLSLFWLWCTWQRYRLYDGV